jgi:hypothetical protein
MRSGLKKLYNKNKHLVILTLLLCMLPRAIVTDPTPRSEFTKKLYALRPVILQAAHRHNVPGISNMSDDDLAVVITLILYDEDLGSFEERIAPLRAITSIRREAEIDINEVFGSNLSIRPSNIRPSVGAEILQHQLPVPPPGNMILVPVSINTNTSAIRHKVSQQDLYRAITKEITKPEKAVEYLAANLERGMYRAHYERVSMDWRTLLAWHIRGIVSPTDIQNNLDAYNYTQRVTYLQFACELVYPHSFPRTSQICRNKIDQGIISRH